MDAKLEILYTILNDLQDAGVLKQTAAPDHRRDAQRVAEKNRRCAQGNQHRFTAMKNRSVKQWVPAPTTDAQRTPNALLGVYLKPGEQVQWAYTITPEGKRIVTGCDITPTNPQAFEKESIPRSEKGNRPDRRNTRKHSPLNGK